MDKSLALASDAQELLFPVPAAPLHTCTAGTTGWLSPEDWLLHSALHQPCELSEPLTLSAPVFSAAKGQSYRWQYMVGPLLE